MRVTIAALILVTAPAPAQADDVQSARQHFATGKRLYDLGRFADAAKEYEAAYQAKDDPALLYNLGQAQRLAGNYLKAILAYKAYLRNVPSADNHMDVEARIKEMQAIVDQQAKTNQRPPQGTLEPAPTPQAASSPTTQLLTYAPAPVHRPLVKRPWLWAAVGAGAAVVATGIALGVVYGKAKDPTPSWGIIGGP